ncbi:MAG: hypothetical protein KC635_19235 [Myxococcales bacterium]|nr:hypothetical protein [Myxococcales bacterium]MCB9734646.1 hypothetical protein [Deltaproteobacteria bacterium]
MAFHGVRAATLCALLGATALLATPSARAAAPDPSRVVYEGSLQDASRQPLSGVYPMTFALYRSQRSSRPAWSEDLMVAVDNGQYTVELGSDKPIPKTLKIDGTYLGVAITDGKELYREKLDTTGADAAAATEEPAPAAPATNGAQATAPTAPTTARPGSGTQSQCEVAGFAYECDRAKAAESIGGLSAKELREAVEAVKAGGKSSLGPKPRYSEAAGGPGGQRYELLCPKGYVVTGIQGGAAMFVDSLSIVCSPLE